MSTEAERGIEPVVALTQHAAEQIKALLSQPGNAGKTLRMQVEQGGCSGLQYSIFFDEPRADDILEELFGVSILVDPTSAEYLRGAVVDFGETLSGASFKITNPNARQSCGCGNSFTA